MENVLRHPVFLAGAATTGFIETHNKELFRFEGHSTARANKLLMYLADMVRHAGPFSNAAGRRLNVQALAAGCRRRRAR